MTPEQLKASILQRAMEGKLVPQDPTDEPASELLKRIKAEKEKLIADGKIKRDKKETELFRGADGKPYEKLADGTIQEVEVPYEIPESWEWVRLGCVASLSFFPNISGDKIPNCSWVLDMEDIEKETGRLLRKNYKTEKSSYKSNKVSFSQNAVLYAKLRPNLKKVIVADEDGFATTELIPIKLFGNTSPEYIKHCMVSPFYYFNIIQSVYGVKMPRVNSTFLSTTLIPLPPLAEQKRIVAQIEKALVKVDEYAESYNKLQQLDKEFPDKLKKSILQYAMQGKLVAQDPNDEPVEVLLEKIKSEKQKLYEEGKLKKKDLAEIVVTEGDDSSPYKEVPYSIPKSWKWVRLNDITSYIQRGKSPKYSTIPKYPVIAQKCNQWSGFSIELAKFVSPDTVDNYQEERLLKDGDLMWNSTGLGTLGRLAIYSEVKNPYGWAVADSHVTIIRLLLKFIDYHFIYHFLASPIVQNVIEEQASGSTKQKELATTTVKNYLIPLPPLTEQQRIVSKISQVFSVIESLV
ncbi:Type I restriction-modification system, specificity subunit S [Streptococcus agalactiae]|uniref:restriction endonuclease subunit S n=3 Tax=Streptococcus agalactiae TaxID=1311 RepID=UPI001025CAF1|nr:restriction endonuclease subunit S [Streptococcus agalactiae]VFA67914.1 Type I restriction-modification system, specificity subunit S [Streptococcus agalactiae]